MNYIYPFRQTGVFLVFLLLMFIISCRPEGHGTVYSELYDILTSQRLYYQKERSYPDTFNELYLIFLQDDYTKWKDKGAVYHDYGYTFIILEATQQGYSVIAMPDESSHYKLLLKDGNIFRAKKPGQGIPIPTDPKKDKNWERLE